MIVGSKSHILSWIVALLLIRHSQGRQLKPWAFTRARLPTTTSPTTTTSDRTQKQIVSSIPRGGGDGGGGGVSLVDPELAGKLLACGFLAQGAAFSLPGGKPNAKFYGWSDTAEDEYLTENLGAAILATGVTSYVLQFKGATVNEAIGWCAIVWSMHHIRWALSGLYQRAGVPAIAAVALALVNALVMYAGFTDASWADQVMMPVFVLFSLVAVHGIFMTDSSADMWGMQKVDEKLKFNAKTFMSWLLVMEVQNISLVNGVAPNKALAYAGLAGLAYFLDGFFVSKGIRLFANQNHAYNNSFWVVYFSCLISSILLA